MKPFINLLKKSAAFGQDMVHHEYIPTRKPSFANPEQGLSRPIQRMLFQQGITSLYSHQAQAIDFIRQGHNVMVDTPTASGKTLIYSLPVLESVLKNPMTSALYLFPLKALEQDQWRALKEMTSSLGQESYIESAIYDGDTPPHIRKKIRAKCPHILITNPDMLHLGMLAFHSSWKTFFSRLKFVIIDEVHTYRGIFGSHMAQVIRRLNRVCRIYGSKPIYLLSSATMANPSEFCERLTGHTPKLVTENGAPAAARHFMFFNPDSSAGITSARIFITCLEQGLRTIAFTQSRKITELMHMWVTQMAPHFRNLVSSYRAGFLSEERRIIERDMGSGRLLGVISTSALEMGIDIGGLDVCILVGYPGTMITTWQRGGRVGRSDRESLIVLVAQPDALDQYFMRHPERFFATGFESTVLDPNNPDILKKHIPCAAAEQPLDEDDPFFSEKLFPTEFEQLERDAVILRGADLPVWYAAHKRPHRGVNLRVAGETSTILDSRTKRTIGSIDGFRAYKECHPGAIYLHMGTQYLVERLDVDKRNVFVKPAKVTYYTRVLTDKETDILEVQRSKPEANFLVKQGYLRVTENVTGFEKRRIKGQELLSKHELDLPEQVFETVGIWIEIENFIKKGIESRGLHFMGGIHALEHAVIAVFPLLTLCDRNDVGGISYPFHPEIGKSAVFIYDGYQGGVGISEKGFELITELLTRALELITSCDCEEGCPACIHSPKCGAGNKPLDKKASRLILEMLLDKISITEEDKGGTEEFNKKSPEPERETSSMLKLAVLDLETQRSAEEVGGWGNTHLMRVSVAVLYDAPEDKFHTYFEKDIDSLIARLKTYDLVVGFNIKRFDYKVLEAYTRPGDLDGVSTFDILEFVHKKLGFRLSLNSLAQRTLGTEKSADGLQALEWFKNGEIDKLVKYCGKDVAITRDLFFHGLKEGYLIFKNREGNLVRITTHWELDKLKDGIWI